MIKNFKMNKKIVVSLMSFSLCITGSSGCNDNIKPKVAIETIEDANGYNLKKDSNYVIIELSNGEVEFAYRVKLSDIANPRDEDNKYSRYYDAEKAYATNTYLYINTDNEIVSVKYTNPNMLNIDNSTSCEINEIVSEDFAYNYMIKYMGSASVYSLQDIKSVIEIIKKDNVEKIKKK